MVSFQRRLTGRRTNYGTPWHGWRNASAVKRAMLNLMNSPRLRISPISGDPGLVVGIRPSRLVNPCKGVRPFRSVTRQTRLISVIQEGTLEKFTYALA